MRIIVVGGGVVALATAHRLAKAGCDVVVLEARTLGSAATHGNAAKIALAESGPVPAPGVILQGLKWMLKPDSPLYVQPSLAPSCVKFMVSMARHCNARDFRFGLETHLRLAEDANDLFDDYLADGIEFEMHKAGVLLAFETRGRYEAQCGSLPVFESFGMHAEHLDHDGVHENEPALSHRTNYGLFFADNRQVEPDSLTRGLVKRCTELGVELNENTRVETFRRTGDQVNRVVTAGVGMSTVMCSCWRPACGVGPCRSNSGYPCPFGRVRATASTTRRPRSSCGPRSPSRMPGWR